MKIALVLPFIILLLCFTCLVAPGRVEVFDLWRCDYKHKENCLQVT